MEEEPEIDVVVISGMCLGDHQTLFSFLISQNDDEFNKTLLKETKEEIGIKDYDTKQDEGSGKQEEEDDTSPKRSTQKIQRN